MTMGFPPLPPAGTEPWYNPLNDAWQGASAEIDAVRTDAGEAREVVEAASTLLDQRGDVAGTLDLSDVETNAMVHFTLTGDVVVTLPTSPIAGRIVTLVIRQDATGGRAVTVPDALSAYGVLPVPAQGANQSCEWFLVFDGVDWKVRVAGTDDMVPVEWEV